MSTLSSSMSTALTGVYAFQASIDVTSNNVSNVNTEGYSRRTVTLASTAQTLTTYGVAGGGVSATSVNRITNSFTTCRIVSVNSELGMYEAEQKYMTGVESLFDESDSSGLSDALSTFWDSWGALANDPSGDTERSMVVTAAEDLADIVTDIYSELREIQSEINDDLSVAVGDVNDITSRIAELNVLIARANASGTDVSDYQDEMDQLTTELSGLVSITTTTYHNGQISVQLSDGTTLVDGSTANTLGTLTDPATGLSNITWSNQYGDVKDVTSTIGGGEIGGALYIRDELIPEYMDRLDEMASTLMTEINSLLTSGYDAEGLAGVALFTGTGAGDMAVTASVADDPDLLAVSSTSDGAPGDGSIALLIIELEDEALLNGGSSTISEFASALAADVGNQVESIDDNVDFQSNLIQYYENYKESVSGVSLDEEAANLVLYQNAYQACLQVITVIQELMDSILEL